MIIWVLKISFNGCETHESFAQQISSCMPNSECTRLLPGGRGTQRLTQLVGYGVSMEMILTGEMITAERAKDIGLVNRVVPSSELMNVTLDIAMEIGKKSPAVLKVAKRAVRSALDLPVSQGILAERSEFVALFDTEDTTIGVEAFLSKNKPEWVGR